MNTEIIVAIGFQLMNLMVLALNLKLYTEILKDKSQDKRSSK